MKKHGRKSTEDLVTSNVVELKPKPKSWVSLTAAQQKVWDKVMSTRSADMIGPECYPILVEYCRCASLGDYLVGQIDAYSSGKGREDYSFDDYCRLLDVQHRNTRMMTTIATKLRITPQARYQPSTAAAMAGKSGSVRTPPWES